MAFFIIGIIILVAGLVLAGFNTNAHKKEMLQSFKQLDQAKAENDPYEIRRAQAEVVSDKTNYDKAKTVSRIVRLAASVLGAVFIVLSVISVVPTGYTGIKTLFGKVDDNTLSSGINFKLPWYNVITMDNREQRTQFTLEAFSKDIQQVDIKGSINVNIDKTTAMNLYRDVGVEYKDILIIPRVLEDVKIVIAKYTAENLVENRQKASDEIYDLLKSELAVKGINVISFAIENIDFTDAFEIAVEAKQVATQEKQKAQTEQERQTMEMQQKAERDRIQAQAAADVQKIEADAKAYAVKVQAEAQAEANKEIAATLSESLIKYNTIQQWNGKLPMVTSEGNNLIDLRGLTEGEDDENH